MIRWYILLVFAIALNPLFAQPVLRIKIGKTNVTYSYREDGATKIIRRSLHADPGAPLREMLQDLRQEDQDILIYVHSMLGNAPLYADVAEAVIRRDIQGEALLIVLDWGGVNPFYGPYRRKATVRGRQLAAILADLPSDARLGVFCHSMGCELTRHWLLHYPGPYPDRLVMFAPDIHDADMRNDADCFTRRVGAITLLASERDILLSASNRFHQQPRVRPADQPAIPHLRNINTDTLPCAGLQHTLWLHCPAAREAIRLGLQ